MTRTRSRRAAAVAVAVTVLAVAVLAAGCGGPRARYAGMSRTVGPEQPDRPPGLEGVRQFRSTRGYRPTPVPVRLEIPRIGVSTSLQRLGRDQHGAVAVPTGPHQWDQAGWYAGGTRPGDPGSAVILGHVDSKRGPAVFFRLRGELRRGDLVEVVRADGSRVRFAVDRVEQYPKRRFPTDDVYYPTLRPMLRLVTCGGAFDRRLHHYLDNVIAFATMVG
jgi:Sortase domain